MPHLSDPGIEQLRQAMNMAYISASMTSMLLISIVVAGFLGFYVGTIRYMRKRRIKRFQKISKRVNGEVKVLTFDKNGIPVYIEYIDKAPGKNRVTIKEFV